MTNETLTTENPPLVRVGLTDLLGGICVFYGMDCGHGTDWTPTVVQQSHHDQGRHPRYIRSDGDESQSSELETPG